MEIWINNIKRYYFHKLVLDIENLTIESGKVTGIIGPNGSGKSTLLRVIAGLDKEFSGEIKYNNEILDKEIYQDMTLVSQKPYLFRRTVYENLEYPLNIRGANKKEKREKIDRIIERFQIQDLRNKKAHLLSGGESQKVNLARALIFRPSLLILDEPTSNIDPESMKIMEKEIIRFNKETSGTVLIVTHNMEQARRLCDNIIELEEGKVGS